MRLSSLILTEIHNTLGYYEIEQLTEFSFLLKFNIWSKINVPDFLSILPEYFEVIEESDYDEDQGYLFYYLLRYKYHE